MSTRTMSQHGQHQAIADPHVAVTQPAAQHTSTKPKQHRCSCCYHQQKMDTRPAAQGQLNDECYPQNLPANRHGEPICFAHSLCSLKRSKGPRLLLPRPHSLAQLLPLRITTNLFPGNYKACTYHREAKLIFILMQKSWRAVLNECISITRLSCGNVVADDPQKESQPHLATPSRRRRRIESFLDELPPFCVAAGATI